MAKNLINRLTWALLKRETVGVDVDGNRYIRMLDKSLDGSITERRIVKYSKHGDLDPTNLTPEWLQWLHKTRKEPPTGYDLQVGQQDRAEQRRRAVQADAIADSEARRWREQKVSAHSNHSRESPPLKQISPSS